LQKRKKETLKDKASKTENKKRKVEKKKRRCGVSDNGKLGRILIATAVAVVAVAVVAVAAAAVAAAGSRVDVPGRLAV
jgi:hypothetical protein